MSEAREQSYERLLAPLERAESGSLDLDGRIYCAINGLVYRSTGKDGSIHFEPDQDGTHTMLTPPPYTASLDVALTLVPKGLHWSLERFPHGTHTAFVSDKWPVGNHYCGQNKASPALALCIASLKARSAR